MLKGKAELGINPQSDRCMSVVYGSIVMLVAGFFPSATAWCQASLPDYQRWNAACKRLPANRELRGAMPGKSLLPLPLFTDFESVLDRFVQNEQKGRLGNPEAWVGDAPDPKKFFDGTEDWNRSDEIPFQPFAEKLVFPTDSRVIIMGDLHGDIRSLLCVLDELNNRKILEGFRIRDPQYRFLFLGDFTDRGAFGVEVLGVRGV